MLLVCLQPWVLSKWLFSLVWCFLRKWKDEPRRGFLNEEGFAEGLGEKWKYSSTLKF